MTMIDEKALAAAEAELSRVLSEVDYNMPTDGMARVLAAYEAAKPAAEPVAEVARLKAIVGLLQDDLAKLSETHDQCEGCGAPISDDEDACTVSDVCGCWGYASDTKGTPCWRYRTKSGMDRVWPECAPLSAPASKNGG